MPHQCPCPCPFVQFCPLITDVQMSGWLCWTCCSTLNRLFCWTCFWSLDEQVRKKTFADVFPTGIFFLHDIPRKPQLLGLLVSVVLVLDCSGRLGVNRSSTLVPFSQKEKNRNIEKWTSPIESLFEAEWFLTVLVSSFLHHPSCTQDLWSSGHQKHARQGGEANPIAEVTSTVLLNSNARLTMLTEDRWMTCSYEA